MTDNMNKALADALAYGTGVMHKSDYVAYGDVYLGPRDSLSQHCPNCEAQAAEIEKLREALQRIQHFSPAHMWRAPDIQAITSAALGETK